MPAVAPTSRFAPTPFPADEAEGALPTEFAADEPVAEPVEETAAEPVETEVAETGEAEAAQAAESQAALIDEATNIYGFSKEQAEALGESLPDVLAAFDRQAAQLMREQQGGAAPTAEQPPKREVDEAEPVKPIAKLEKFELPIDRDIHDEGTLKAFDSLTEEINKGRDAQNQQQEVLRQMAQLLVETHNTAKQVVDQTTDQTTAEFTRDMDDFFAGLPDEFKDIYGKEPLSQMTDGSPKVIARNALINEMGLLRDADTRAKRPTRQNKEQATRTLRALHADKLHVAARKDVEQQINKRRATAIAQPSGRNLKPADRRGRALANIEAKLTAMGLK